MRLAFSPLMQWSTSALPTTPTGMALPLPDTSTSITIATANNDITASASALDILWSPETVLSPLNAASEPWVRSLVWLDFKVAVSFFVVAPLILLSWAVVARIPSQTQQNDNDIDVFDKKQKQRTTSSSASISASPPPIAETILRYMTSYWQASSLLLLTLALDIQEQTICVLIGLLAQAMIVVSLWWWEDLNDELVLMNDSDSNGGESSIANAFILWRNVATFAASSGVIIQVPFQTCIQESSLLESSWCAPWLEPPKFASGLIGVSASPTLELLTLSGCALYAIVVLYYVVVLIPSVGRSGRAARPKAMNVASPVGAWQMMGFLEKQNKPE